MFCVLCCLNQDSEAFRNYTNIGPESDGQTLLAMHFNTWAVANIQKGSQRTPNTVGCLGARGLSSVEQLGPGREGSRVQKRAQITASIIQVPSRGDPRQSKPFKHGGPPPCLAMVGIVGAGV